MYLRVFNDAFMLDEKQGSRVRVCIQANTLQQLVRPTLLLPQRLEPAGLGVYL